MHAISTAVDSLWINFPAPGGLCDAYLALPPEHALCDALAVGDLVGCGISHPCTTFDKWPLLLAVDDDYAVRYAVNTFF